MFIDTSGWLILFDKKSSQHSKTLELYRSRNSKVTHSYVIVELVSLAISRRHTLSRIVDFVVDLLNDGSVEVVWIDEEDSLKALELLTGRRDKSWSLCDAVSFELMSQFGITEALTTDHHFEQAGFIKLLES